VPRNIAKGPEAGKRVKGNPSEEAAKRVAQAMKVALNDPEFRSRADEYRRRHRSVDLKELLKPFTV